MRSRAPRAVARLAVVLVAATAASATEVQVVGITPGRSAKITIDGGAPLRLNVGEGTDTVKLLSVDRDGATLRVDGATRNIPLGAVAGGSGARSGTRGDISIPVDPSGHFVARGRVNGRPLSFLVDTGATLTVIPRAEADKMGLAYRDSPRVPVQTANGVGQAWLVTLRSVEVSGASVPNVQAAIQEGLPYGLLGMSFLSHFDLDQRGSTLVLRRRR